jgi:hypothetical protein
MKHRKRTGEHFSPNSELISPKSETIWRSSATLMAWIRTALSMIGFGFTIYKFFQYLPAELAAGNVRRPQAPYSGIDGSGFTAPAFPK